MQKGACIPLRVHTIVISIQHSEDVSMEQLRTDLMEHVVKAVVPHQYLDEKTVYHLQPSGKFVIGGPQVCVLDILYCLSVIYFSSLFASKETTDLLSVCLQNIL